MKYQSIAALITSIQNDNLSAKSKEGYISKLKFLHQQLSTDGTVSWLKDAPSVTKWIEERYNSIDSRKSCNSKGLEHYRSNEVLHIQI